MFCPWNLRAAPLEYEVRFQSRCLQLMLSLKEGFNIVRPAQIARVEPGETGWGLRNYRLANY